MGVWTASIAKLQARLPDLLSLSGAEARILLALRHAVVCHKLGRNPRPGLEEKLGSGLAATRFLIVIETVGSAWPESFHIGRTCCPCTTPDEILLLQMTRLGGTGDRPAFDRLIMEMIGDSERNRIFIDISNFASAYRHQATD